MYPISSQRNILEPETTMFVVPNSFFVAEEYMFLDSLSIYICNLESWFRFFVSK